MSLRSVLWIASVIVVFGASAAALAHPVRIGRYVEIPYGWSDQHPYATADANPQRNAASQSLAPESAPSLQWEVRLPVGRAHAPAVGADGNLYVAGSAGLISLAPDGNIRWSLRAGFTTGTPSFGPGGVLVVGTQAGEVISFSTEGAILSTARLAGALRGSPLVLADGSIVGPGVDRRLHRIDAEGRAMVNVPLPAQPTGPAAWLPSGLIAVAAGNEVLLITPDGEIHRRVALSEVAAVGPAVGLDGDIWIITSDGALYVIDAATGVQGRGTASGLPTGLAIGRDGAARIAGRDRKITCMEPNGAERWAVDDIGAFVGGLAIDRANNTIAITQDGTLVALDPTGRVRWRVSADGRTHAPPALAADGTIYVLTDGAILQAWR